MMHKYQKGIGLIILNCFIAIVAGCSSWSVGLASGHYNNPEERYWSDHDYDVQGRSLKIYPKERKNRRIQGVCIIKDSNDLFDNYCNNIEVYLEDKNKNIIASTKTEASGTFIFNNIKKGTYQLKVLDKRYQKVSSIIYVTPGSEVLIHLEKIK